MAGREFPVTASNNIIMIEIKQRNGIWEVYVDGSLFRYDNDLGALFDYLARNVENIKDEFYE